MTYTIDIDRIPPEILLDHGGERERWTAFFVFTEAPSRLAVDKAMAEIIPCAVGTIYGHGEYLVTRVEGPMDEAVINCADKIRPIKPLLPKIIEVGLISYTDLERQLEEERPVTSFNVTHVVLNML